MFHLIRYAHIADSCVNCGQCEEVCPAEIPNALFMHAQQVELEKMFGHVPGVNMELPLMAYVEEKEERGRLHNTGSDMIYQNVFNPLKNKNTLDTPFFGIPLFQAGGICIPHHSGKISDRLYRIVRSNTHHIPAFHQV